MILSNVEIQKALDERRLVIDPEPSPRELKPGIKYCPYDTTAVDLKLHNEISVPKGGTFAYDLTKPGSVSDFLARNSKKLILTEDQPFPLEPRQFILGKTFEKIELPLDKGPPYFASSNRRKEQPGKVWSSCAFHCTDCSCWLEWTAYT